VVHELCWLQAGGNRESGPVGNLVANQSERAPAECPKVPACLDPFASHNPACEVVNLSLILGARLRFLAARLSVLALCWWSQGLGAVTQLDPSMFRVRSWTMEQGLPDNQIKALHQTPDGSLWIGTRSGLARFADGHFTVFNHVNTPEMISDDCDKLSEDGEGDLWVHTSERLLRFRNGKFTAFEEIGRPSGTESPTRRGSLGGRVFSLTPRSDGGLWFGGRTRNHLVSRWWVWCSRRRQL